ncbi:MAG: sulfotransferase [Phycisphaerales bacterium JB040]
MAKRPQRTKQLPEELNAQQALVTAQTALNAGDYRTAAALMIRLSQAAPHFDPAHLAIGIAFNRMGRYAEAIDRLTTAHELASDPERPEAPNPQVEMGRRFNAYMVHTELARAYTKSGDLDAAQKHLDLAQPVTEESVSKHAHAARLQLARADAKAAADTLRPLLKQGDTDVEIALAAAEVALAAPDALPPAEAADHVLATSKRVGLPAGVLILLLHAAADVCDACGRRDEAVAAWRRAKTIPRVQFKPRIFMAEVLNIVKGWTPDSIANVVRADTNDPTPVLVVGTPGRMNDAVARLIAAHPDAANAGATNFLSEIAHNRFNAPTRGNFVALLRPGTIRGNDTREAGQHYTRILQRHAGTTTHARIVDANATNLLQLGMLSVMNPHAHVVHVVADPFDAAFDAWTTHSGYAHPFVTENASLALYTRADQIFRKHWEHTFQQDRSRQPYHVLSFKNLRDQPEQTARALFMFLGLDWHDHLADAARDAADTRRPDPANYRKSLKGLAEVIDRATITPEAAGLDAQTGQILESSE